MSTVSRREFIKASLAGAAVLHLPKLSGKTELVQSHQDWMGPVPLGKSGVSVSRVAMGSGVDGWRYNSNLKRLGAESFLDLLLYNYERGITFVDTADIYGTHENIKEIWAHIPRENIQIMTKVWTKPNNWATIYKPDEVVEQFRKELGTDYIDIVLIHSQTSSNWLVETKAIRNALSEAKEKGLIGALGVSCHSWEAMLAASESDWVEVILSRINNNGARLDNDPEKVMQLLKKMHDQGKGVIGMKIFGGGQTTSEQERESSLRFVLKSGVVDAISLGMEKKVYVDDALSRIQNILQ
ncbi:aldo/keto reductase [bacterium]